MLKSKAVSSQSQLLAVVTLFRIIAKLTVKVLRVGVACLDMSVLDFRHGLCHLPFSDDEKDVSLGIVLHRCELRDVGSTRLELANREH